MRSVKLVAIPSTSHYTTSVIGIVTVYSITSSSVFFSCMSYYSSLSYFSSECPITAHLVPSITIPITTDLMTSAAEAGLISLTASPVVAPQESVGAFPPLHLPQHHSPCMLSTSSVPLLFGTTSTLHQTGIPSSFLLFTLQLFDSFFLRMSLGIPITQSGCLRPVMVVSSVVVVLFWTLWWP